MIYLVIAAHPDDEVLGCGGTIARLVEEKNDVYVGIFGEGATSRISKDEIVDRQLVENLKVCSRKVSEMLGVKELFFYDFPLRHIKLD